MRKVLSFVLVLAMVLGCVSMAFAAQMSDVAGTKYENAVNALTELGVIDGYGDGTYRPGNQVTRAQFVKLVVSALGYKPSKTATPFKDVPADNLYSGYVAYAYTLGITNGKTKTTFAPNDPVTYNQAIAFLTRAMGYTQAYLETLGNYSYPLSEIIAAEGMGMLKTSKTTGNGAATRGDIALLIYDLLNVPTKVYSSANKTWADGQTLLQKLGARVSYVGVIDGNETFAKGFNYIPYLGKYVEAYANDKGEIFGVKEVKSKTLVGKLSAGKTVLTVDGVKYDVTGHASFGAIFVNTELQTPSNWAGLSNNVEYTFEAVVSGKKVTNVYSASKWEIKEDKKVVAADLTKLTADRPSLLAKPFELDDNYEIKTTSFELVGVGSLADIKKDNIVYVYSTSDHIVKVAVGTEVVEGKITRKDGTKYTINGVQYSTVNDADVANVAVNNTVKAYLDADGKIYCATLVSGTANTYAVVLNAANGNAANWAKGTDASNAKVRLYNMADGTVKDYYVVNDDVISGKTDYQLKTAYEAILTKGAIVKYGLNSEDKLNAVESVTGFAKASAVTKNGYIGNAMIADNAVVIAATTGVDIPTSTTSKLAISTYDKSLAVSAKSAVLGVNAGTNNILYHTSSTTGYVDIIFVKNTAVNDTVKTYKTISGTGTKVVDDKAVTWITFLGDATEYVTEDTVNKNKLYQVQFDTLGKADLSTAKSASETYKASDYTSAYITLTLDDNGIKAVKDAADTTVETDVYALTDSTVYLKLNNTTGYYEEGSKGDLEGKLTNVKLFSTASSETYITFVLYTVY